MWNKHRQAQCTLCSLFLTAALTNPGYAEIYQTTDEQGLPVFTDQPPSGQQAEKVKLQPTNITPPPVEIPVFKKPTTQASAPKSNSTGNSTSKSESETSDFEELSGATQNNKDNLIKEAAKARFDKSGTQQKKVDQKLKHLPKAQRKQVINAAKRGTPKAN